MKQNRLEDAFQSHSVTAGDTFFVAAGTPHTIGPRVILCEVQEYSDVTYRVDDYGRVDGNGKARALHIEKVLEVMKFGAEASPKVRPLHLPGERVHKMLLAACPYFSTERWEFRATVQAESLRERFELFVILDGTGHIYWQGAPLTYQRGQCWFFPASLGNFCVQPEQTTSLIPPFFPPVHA